MAKIAAVRKETYDNLQFDAGVLFQNLDISTAKTAGDLLALLRAATEDERLGVTRGGSEFKSEAEWREIEFDDSPGSFVGSSEKGKVTVTLTTTLLEATVQNIMLAMGTADMVTTVDGTVIIQERGSIDPLKDYISKVLLVTRKGKEEFNVVEMDNVISIGGFNQKNSSGSESEIAVTLQATKDSMDSGDALPYRIIYFPKGA